MEEKEPVLPPLTESEAQAIEKNEIDLLTNKGVFFDVEPLEDKSFWSKFKRKEKTQRFYIYPSFLGTMDLLAAEFIQMRFDQIALQDDWYEEIKRMVQTDVKRCAKIVAIAVLNKKDMSEVDKYTDYFLWRLTAPTLLKVCQIIYNQAKLQDFFASIALLSVKERTTSPAPIEKKNEVNQPA